MLIDLPPSPRYACSTAAIKVDPTYVKAWVRRGLVLHARGRYLDAIKDLEHALTLKPGDKQVCVCVGTYGGAPPSVGTNLNV